MIPAASPLPRGALATEVQRLIDGFSGSIAVWFHDLTRGETHGIRSDEPFPPASTIKLFVLRELFRQVELRRLSLNDPIVLRREDVVPGSGVLKNLQPGLAMCVADAAMLMITVSDNVATNMLIDRLGTTTINRATRRAGYPRTLLRGKLYSGLRVGSTTTAGEMGACMLEIARGEAVSDSASVAMLNILYREQYQEIVGRQLPGTGLADASWRVASKGGMLDGVRNDVAYVERGDVRYVVALLSRDCADRRFTVDNEANLCLAAIAGLVHAHVIRSS